MRENLSFTGLLLQARDVVRARWGLLLTVAGGWALALLAANQLKVAVMTSAGPDSVWSQALPLLAAVPDVIGTAVMVGVVVRTGEPPRPLAESLRHAAIAATTVLAIFIVHDLGLMWLSELAATALTTAPEPTPLIYAASLASSLLRLALFVVFGMTLPAALERPLAPWTAVATALALSAGHRGWLLIFAIIWSVISLAPLLVVTVVGLSVMKFATPMLFITPMLTAIAFGVLYLELRRLHGRVAPGAAAETFA